jgi:hypothetical protein
VHVSGEIRATPGSSDGGEAHEHGRLLISSTEERRRREVAPVGIAGESAMGSCATGMDSPFGYLERTVSVSWRVLVDVSDVSDVSDAG